MLNFRFVDTGYCIAYTRPKSTSSNTNTGKVQYASVNETDLNTLRTKDTEYALLFWPKPIAQSLTNFLSSGFLSDLKPQHRAFFLSFQETTSIIMYPFDDILYQFSLHGFISLPVLFSQGTNVTKVIWISLMMIACCTSFAEDILFSCFDIYSILERGIIPSTSCCS